VTIKPGKRKNIHGQIMIGRVVIRRPKLPQSSEQTKAEVNAALMECYAGAICEAAATGKSVEPSSLVDDHNHAVGLVTALLGEHATPENLQTVIARIYLETMKVFASPENWRAVVRVADALIARQTLTGGEVKHLVFRNVNRPERPA
jgi:hypothetical protein